MYVDTFDEAKPFNENYAAVRIGFEWFIAHLKTKSLRRLDVLYRPTGYVSNVGSFTEGLAPVRVKGQNKTKSEGFLDTFGDFAIKPRYTRVYNFHKGYAPIIKGRRLRRTLRFLVPDGTTARWGKFNSVSDYGEYLFPTKRFQYWGYLDTRSNLKEALPFQYLDATPFSEGTAFVKLESTNKYRCINTKGDLLLYRDFDYGYSFSNNYALIYQDDLGSGKHHGFRHGFGYIGKDNLWLIEPSLFKARPFYAGLAVAAKRRKNGSVVFGILNTKGEWLVKPKYEYCLDYHRRRSAFCKKGLWGYLDKDGEVIIPPEYYSASSFSPDDLAVVEVEPHKYKYITQYGKFLKFRYNYNRGRQR